MNSSLPEQHGPAVIRELRERESRLQQGLRAMELRYSGLTDVDGVIQLASVRIELALAVLEAAPSAPEPEELLQEARSAARKSIEALEALRAANVSQEQRDFLSKAPGFEELRERMQRFLLAGGAALLEQEAVDEKHLRLVSRAIADAVRQHGRADDRTPPLFRTERLPRLLRRLVNMLLPVLAPEHQAEPPYGIPDGQELLYSSEKMKMPLSQAILYYEEELLPALERQLQGDPGNPSLQRRLTGLRREMAELKRMRFFPRSTPIVMEKGFYTDWMTEYTSEGELLITVRLPVTFSSGTNTDRLQEAVKADVVRRLAGKGVSPELDRDYRYRKSLESGRRGSSRVPSQRVDTVGGFRKLKSGFPALRRLEDKGEFRRLVAMITERHRGPAVRMLESILRSEGSHLTELP